MASTSRAPSQLRGGDSLDGARHFQGVRRGIGAPGGRRLADARGRSTPAPRRRRGHEPRIWVPRDRRADQRERRSRGAESGAVRPGGILAECLSPLEWVWARPGPSEAVPTAPQVSWLQAGPMRVPRSPHSSLTALLAIAGAGPAAFGCRPRCRACPVGGFVGRDGGGGLGRLGRTSEPSRCPS